MNSSLNDLGPGLVYPCRVCGWPLDTHSETKVATCLAVKAEREQRAREKTRRTAMREMKTAG